MVTPGPSSHEIHLYYSPGLCSLVVHILLEVSGLPFKLTEWNAFSGVFPPELIPLNPKKQIPFIELEPGVILTEVPAIITAIAQRVPEKKLLGKTDLDILRSYEWFNYLSGQLHARRWGAFVRPQRYVDDERWYPMVKELATGHLHESFEYIESQLKGLEPPNEHELKAFDVYLFVVAFQWPNRFDLDLKNYPVLTQRMIEVSKFEAVKRATETEGIPLLGA